MSGEWQMTCWYLIVLIPVAQLAKMGSLWRAGVRRPFAMVGCSFFWAPWLSLPSWEKRTRLEAGQSKHRLLLVSCGQLAAITAVYVFFIPMIRAFPLWLQSYLAIVPFWLLLEALGGLCRLLWLPSGRLVPTINNRPWQAKHLADFWGRRWNRLIGDWLHQVVFMPLRRQPNTAMFATFLVSGIIHELLVSLPFMLVYGKSIWGLMTGYFLIQYLAIRIERWLQLSAFGKRMLLWIAVLLPVPLVLNCGTLHIFHLGG
ncbi:Membrane bound O-acyl transferase family protein [Desulfopila aestuarii DSM 18488]|uniref:Membrane bound O-acyl transferase family protein n=2 Tax=Desulfopila aestuarii TaxID=231440 RepID=A0A1M7Y5T7_9BACT|nr:Membrane bound O-acyl transferase family protein [Desulfopila aestuarii DSM 18488]